MQHKLRFIMPRLIGATVVAGLAALLITTLFKLLLAATVSTGVVAIISRQAGKRHSRYMAAQYGQNTMTGFGKRNGLRNSNDWANPMVSITGNAAQKGKAFIPVN